jgi:hypothetical protein
MESSPKPKRSLTDGELFVLGEVQAIHGPQNSTEMVLFSDRDEAVIFAKDVDGAMVIAVVLTNLSNWLDDGTISSVEELRRDWLQRPV